MSSEKKNTVLLGLAFLVFLVLSSVENTVFFQVLSDVLLNPFLAIPMLFIHDLLVVSIIILGMTFYVNLVLHFFKENKYELTVIEHPRVFATVFTVVILLLSILRGSNLIYGGVSVEALPVILFVSAPIGIVEGYGIYLAIRKTLSRSMSMRELCYIYGIFLVAAVMEVVFINVLLAVTTK
ncbi:hypothetical protein KEJ15_00460 [Candidatus Bathyarchaeota archaeon]|nr:hypothetical protein [Candidatus Bathyarchaeota archaeon]